MLRAALCLYAAGVHRRHLLLLLLRGHRAAALKLVWLLCWA
jgi:hypothetical protein